MKRGYAGDGGDGGQEDEERSGGGDGRAGLRHSILG